MMEILTPGPLATVQDLGRPGYRALGVGRSGAADSPAHRLANRLVGNAADAATIEITLGGLGFRTTSAVTVAFTGARCPTGALPWEAAVSLPAGTVVRLGTPQSGARSYLAVRGGFAVPAVLGSRATDTLAGLGPSPLQAGDMLPLGTAVAGDPSDEAVVPADGVRPIRLVAGPRQDWFAAGALPSLTGAVWSVASDSSRIGVRLTGPALQRTRTDELPPEATLPGAIQVPPSGQPIVLGPDSPVTGGYPVIAVVVAADLPRLGRLRPGDEVRFRQA